MRPVVAHAAAPGDARRAAVHRGNVVYTNIGGLVGMLEEEFESFGQHYQPPSAAPSSSACSSASSASSASSSISASSAPPAPVPPPPSAAQIGSVATLLRNARLNEVEWREYAYWHPETFSRVLLAENERFNLVC